MKQLLALSLAAALAAVLVPAPAARAETPCYADYKAKQDAPLRLHYGVAALSGACSREAAESELAPRLADGGWVLLTVMSVFAEEGLDERKASAGQYYLRY